MKIPRQLLTMLLVLICAAALHAVPSNPTPRVYEQPDGTEVTLSLIGDEFYHFFMTTDKQMVVRQNGAFYFAEAAADGTPAPSKVLAADPAKRNAAQKAFVARTDAAKLLKGARKAAAANRASRKVTPKQGLRAPAKSGEGSDESGDWASKGLGTFSYSTFPTTGSPRLCIILVEFQDVEFVVPNPKQYFTGFASKTGFDEPGAYGDFTADLTPTGSCKEFYQDASSGQFDPQFDVYGPVKLQHPVSYYGAREGATSDINPHLMVSDAVEALDGEVDFSVYDNDGDDIIDMVYVIFAGLGEANGGDSDRIWPHSWYVKSGGGVECVVDEKWVDRYACSAELFYYQKTESAERYIADGIGTFCHEFGHVLGLPDEYDITYTTAYNDFLTPIQYSLMDQGSYNNYSRTPPTLSIFQRNALGWADIEVLEPGKGRDIEMEHALKTNFGYAIETKDLGGGSVNEFFLLESRQPTKWDAPLLNHGLLVWHINYDKDSFDWNMPNVVTEEKDLICIDLVSACNDYTQLSGRPFPGTGNVTSFTSSTTPALKTTGGVGINLPLTEITQDSENQKVTFKVCGGAVPMPKWKVNDTATEEVSFSDTKPMTLVLEPAAEGLDVRYEIFVNEVSSGLKNYSEPITISNTCVVKTCAYRTDDENLSDVAELTFDIRAFTPVLMQEEGEVEAGTKVAISCETEDAVIRYTTDGTAPTSESAQYTAPIEVTENMTISAYASKENLTDSEVATAAYTVREPAYPESADYDAYTFCFTKDTAYGMTLRSGEDTELNDNPYTCTSGNAKMVINGSTQWYDKGNGKELRCFTGSSFDIEGAEGYKVIGAKPFGTANWSETEFSGFADKATFTSTHGEGFAALKGVDVQVVLVPAFTADEVNAKTEESISILCKLHHDKDQHVKQYKFWVVEMPADSETQKAPGEETVVGSVVIPALEIQTGDMTVAIPVSIAKDSGLHKIAVRGEAVVTENNPVYAAGWKEGDVEGSTGNEGLWLDTSNGIVSGITSVFGDENESGVIYYNLQGHRIAAPEKGEAVIRVESGKAVKIRK